MPLPFLVVTSWTGLCAPHDLDLGDCMLTLVVAIGCCCDRVLFVPDGRTELSFPDRAVCKPSAWSPGVPGCRKVSL